MYMCSPYLFIQIPTSTVVSMVVQSDKQLEYLAANESPNSLRVLLFEDDLWEALTPFEVSILYGQRLPLGGVLDYVLLNVARTSTDLAWLRLVPNDFPIFETTVVHIQSLRSLRVLEIIAWKGLTDLNISGLKELQHLDFRYCEQLFDLVVNGLAKLQYLNVGKSSRLTTLQGLDELTKLKYLYLSQTDSASALAGLSELIELQHLIMINCRGFSDLP
jgi:Leucine-rich repeat (LRR) protein